MKDVFTIRVSGTYRLSKGDKQGKTTMDGNSSTVIRFGSNATKFETHQVRANGQDYELTLVQIENLASGKNLKTCVKTTRPLQRNVTKPASSIFTCKTKVGRCIVA